MSLQVDLSHSAEKEEMLYGSEHLDGLKDLERFDDIDAYGMGKDAQVQEVVLRAGEVKMAQRYMPEGDSDRLEIHLESEDTDLEDYDDLRDYKKEANQDEEQVIEYFLETADSSIELCE